MSWVMRGNGASIFWQASVRRSQDQRRVHGSNCGDEALGFFDESVGTRGRQDFLHSLERRSRLGILLQFQPVEAEGVIRLAELLPGRLLVFVEVFQVVETVRPGRAGRPCAALNRSMNLLALAGQQRLDERQAVAISSSPG